MKKYDIDEYKKEVKKKRKKRFEKPFDFVYQVFCDCGYDKKASGFFFDHASEYVENMRKCSWEKYRPLEKEFTSEMIRDLIDMDYVKKMSAEDAIIEFSESYPDHIYNLSLSNTQSRRSRAGNEFEAIIQLLFTGAELSVDTQGSLGKKYFVDNKIGKLVDFVTPGVTYYFKNKMDTLLISAKTTLRERWQEVPEEVDRTGIDRMFLATMDDSISSETLKILYESRITIVTTKTIKENNYEGSNTVITFEELLRMSKNRAVEWEGKVLSDEDVDDIICRNEKMIKKFKKQKYNYLVNYYTGINEMVQKSFNKES